MHSRFRQRRNSLFQGRRCTSITAVHFKRTGHKSLWSLWFRCRRCIYIWIDSDNGQDVDVRFWIYWGFKRTFSIYCLLGFSMNKRSFLIYWVLQWIIKVVLRVFCLLIFNKRRSRLSAACMKNTLQINIVQHWFVQCKLILDFSWSKTVYNWSLTSKNLQNFLAMYSNYSIYL